MTTFALRLERNGRVFPEKSVSTYDEKLLTGTN